jgi:hypothetical protein
MTTLFSLVTIGVGVLFIVAIVRNKATGNSSTAPGDPTRSAGDDSR